MPRQGVIGVDPKPENTLDTFVYPPQSELLQKQLSSDDIRDSALIWGASGCGCTHLLQASHLQAGRIGISSHYIDLAIAAEPLDMQVLQHLRLLCLDNADRANEQTERGLVGALDAFRIRGVRLLLGVHSGWQERVGLADLRTRLTAQASYYLADLDDGLRREALQRRAAYYGMDMPEKVTSYLLTRYERNNHALFGNFAILSKASLQFKRPLSVPFVREVLSQGQSEHQA